MSGLQAGDIVTVKASNGIELSRIIKKLTEPAPVAHAANGT
jgi:UDP-N-acetylmuramyl pentapeptide synthase